MMSMPISIRVSVGVHPGSRGVGPNSPVVRTMISCTCMCWGFKELCFIYLEGPALTEVFHPMEYEENFSGTLNVEVRVCHRHEHCATLHIRAARLDQPTF